MLLIKWIKKTLLQLVLIWNLVGCINCSFYGPGILKVFVVLVVGFLISGIVGRFLESWNLVLC